MGRASTHASPTTPRYPLNFSDRVACFVRRDFEEFAVPHTIGDLKDGGKVEVTVA